MSARERCPRCGAEVAGADMHHDEDPDVRGWWVWVCPDCCTHCGLPARLREWATVGRVDVQESGLAGDLLAAAELIEEEL